MGKVLRAVVYGCGLTALVQGTLVCIGFAIAGLSGPIVFGVLASVLALLPFGGAALVWVPGMLYLLATGSFGWAMFMLAWGGVVSISDNFIRPAIISRYTPVPTLAGVPRCHRRRRRLRSHRLHHRTGDPGAGHGTAALRRRIDALTA